ncbi:TPR repeat-containing protein NMB0313 precursor [Rodentibacter pneumotropicus]|uniref:TPR repeat-containing protein NMB0313 n=2 Tax=Rodentibacter pneumotropicus TaxID=758 RepID=A0A448MLG4_9PAST|nr:TPR repeat-containing protein NMB0313 precursor [Rodentibacter pneumotropicus]
MSLLFIMKKFAYFLPLVPFLAQAETVHLPKSIFFEETNVPKTDEPQLKTPQKSTALSTPQIALNERDSMQTKLEKLINYGVVNQQWRLLKRLLPLYQAQAHYDATLYRYAKGAMLRAERQYAEAISLYQQIVNEHPALAYPRFDLGVMRFENKQYRQAKADIEQAVPDLSPQMRGLAQRYLQEMKTRQNWQVDAELQYMQTDNVNNASDQQDILLGGLRFQKDKDSLPQKAHGFRYGLGLNREVNVAGNHFVAFNGYFNGVHYWDNQDYSEKSLYATLGYRYRSALQSVGFMPFFEQNWLGSPRYSKNYGVVANFQQELTARWSISGTLSHTQKRYAETNVARRHNGYINGAILSFSYQAKPNWLLFGGIEGSVDHSQDKAESFLRRGINLGTIWQIKDFAMRLSGRYVKRDFRAENFYFPTKKRQDKEYGVNVTVWHNKLQWKGFTPKLNYRYRKIDSNIPEFYSRQTSEFFMSIEKNF